MSLFSIVLFVLMFISSALGVLRRPLSVEAPELNTIANIFVYIGVQLPLGLLVGYIVGFKADIGWLAAGIIFLCSSIFPLIEIVSYKINESVDASEIALIWSLVPVFAIALSGIFLEDTLTPLQYVGSAMLLVSSFLIAYSTTSRISGWSLMMVVAVVTAFGEAVGDVYESWAIEEITLVSYLIYGVVFQAFWAVAFAFPRLGLLRTLAHNKHRNQFLTYCAARGLYGFFFLAALHSTGSLALTRSVLSFSPIIVIITAYYYLGEKQQMPTKIIATILGVIGLIAQSRGVKPSRSMRRPKGGA